jgi:serine/threonine protein kinase
MGIVYKGRDPKLGRLTAIKTIRFTDDFDEDQVEKIKEQFYREAEVVAKLSHPNIVTIYDVGEDLELSYLAMEYLEGESLEKYAERGSLLAIRKCLDVVGQVCDALDYAHSRGIVHRDIKPANIMILKNGLVKVTDFGIARATATSKTRTGVIKGTPYYMSPEQISGMRVDGRSDIFSLGVVFYQLMTGELPFGGENLAAIMYQITSVPHDPPTKYNPKIYKAAVAILDRALEKKLEKRYHNAKQMGDHLRLLGQKLDEVKFKAKRQERPEPAAASPAPAVSSSPEPAAASPAPPASSTPEPEPVSPAPAAKSPEPVTTS